jgi:hypothetical protein
LRWQKNGNRIWTAKVAGEPFEQLFINGKQQVLARYPNYDSTARVFNGTAADAISRSRTSRWKNPAGGYLHAIHQSEWGDIHYRITGKAGDTLTYEGGWQNNRPMGIHKSHRFVENIYEELDAPGEWFYDKATQTLSFYPPSGFDPNTAVVEVSRLKSLVELVGTPDTPLRQVRIQGIRLVNTERTFMEPYEPLLRSDWTLYRGAAVYLENTEDCRIESCELTQLGGNAVLVSRYNRNASVAGCHIHHVGATAIGFVGDTSAVRSPAFRYEAFVPVADMDKTAGPKNNRYPAQCRAYDNLIHSIGTIEKQVAGVEISMAMDITVSHNTIYHVPRSGINVGDGCWGGHQIEFNDVFDTVLETGDHGAFNSWGRDRFWLPGIDDVNALVAAHPSLPRLDVIKPITLHNNRFHCEHGWDIDLDDGSSHYQIDNNLCLNGGLKLREGFYRVVENNILVNNTFHPHVWYAQSQDVFRHNIVTMEYAPIRIPVWGKEVDYNFFIQKRGLESAQASQTDQHSLQGDPDFVNAAAGDYRVKPESKALTVGFRNFPMNEFGVVSASLRRKAPQAPVTGIRTLDAVRTGATTEWLGASIKNIETLGEQSASGLPDREGVLITGVAANSLAKRSGLEVGDAIRMINGKPVFNVAEMLNALQVVMWQGSAKATIWREQQAKEVRILLK